MSTIPKLSRFFVTLQSNFFALLRPKIIQPNPEHFILSMIFRRLSAVLFLKILALTKAANDLPEQCIANFTDREPSLNIVPPVVWKNNGTEFEPVLVKVKFNVWDIQHADDFKQSLVIVGTFTQRWSDQRLRDICELHRCQFCKVFNVIPYC